MAHKYVNLQEPYNQDIKEKDKTLYKTPNPEAKCAKVVFQIKSPICGVNFSNNISIALVKVNERKN